MVLYGDMCNWMQGALESFKNVGLEENTGYKINRFGKKRNVIGKDREKIIIKFLRKRKPTD